MLNFNLLVAIQVVKISISGNTKITRSRLTKSELADDEDERRDIFL